MEKTESTESMESAESLARTDTGWRARVRRRIAQTLGAAMLAGGLLTAGSAAAAAPGVSRDTIVLGSVGDLSGPIAMLGVPVRDAMQMHFDAVNAAGGVHGRQIRLVVEDAAYDPKKAVLAARKLIEHDDVFAFIGTMGTAAVMAAMPIAVEAQRPHLFPFSPHASTYLPLSPYKFQIFAPYQDYMNAATRAMLARGDYARVCLLYQDDDYGLEVLKGVEAALAQSQRTLTARTAYKRGATDLSSQIARLRQADCSLVVLATVVRETVAALSEARKIGWQVDMLVTASGYSAQTHELGGAAVEGMYGVAVLPHPYRDGANAELAAWIDAYQARFGVAPNVWSAMGDTMAALLVQALQAAGPELSTAGFVRALEGVQSESDMFGGPPYRFSATDHLGNRRGRLARIENGRWRIISDYLD